MDFREKSLDKMMGSKLQLPRLQQKTLNPITKQTTQKANVSTIGTNPFKSDVLNRKYKNTVKKLYAQGNRDPLGNAYSAVSQYKDIVTAAYQHNGADPLKAAEDQYNNTMWQFGMEDRVQGKTYEDLNAMLEESRKIKTTDTAKQAFYTGLPEYLSSKYAQSKSYSGLLNDPKLKARYNLPYREPVQVKQLTDQEKAYWDEMKQNPETAKWAEYANKPMTEEARQEMAAYAASLAGQEDTEETKWLEDYIKRNTAKGAQAWAEAEPENQMAKDTAYFVTNQERYTGTPEEVWQHVQAARNEEAQKKADEMSAFLPQMQQLTQEIYQSGKNPLDYFMGGYGTQEQADMWQRLNDSDNPELAALTQYAAKPWDDTADAIISKYAYQPDTRPFDAAYAQANPAYMDGNYQTVNEGGYKSIQAGNMAVDREVYNALYELDPEEAERYRLYKTYEGHQLRNDLLAAGAAQTAKEDPVGATGASWFLNLGRGINYVDALGQNVGRALSLRSDRPIDYMRTADMGTMADTYQQTVASGIESDFWRTMYGVGNSTVNTLLTAPLGPGGAAFVMGSQAAQQRMQELQKLRQENNIDTMTDADILMGGAVAGAIEYVFEKVSIGKLYNSMNTLGKGGFMAYAKDILAQAGINGSEEAMTTIANKIYDGLTMGENSEYMRDVMYYNDTLQLDEEKAKNLAMNRIMDEVAEDAISGALQGLLMGGVSNTVSGTRTHAQNKRTGNAAISADTQQTIIKMGLKMGKDTDAYKMASKMQGKKISAADLGRLMKAEAQAAEGGLLGIAPAVQEVQQTIRLVLEERGETGDLELISGAVVDMLMGNQLEGDQMAALAGSDTALSYVEDALQEKGVLGDMEETEKEADELEEVPWQETEPAEETEAAEEETEAPAPVNLEGLGMVAETEDGTITLRNEAGEETDLQDTDMDDAEKKVIAAGLHRNAALTEGMRKAYRAKTDKLTAEEAGDWAEGYMAVAEAAERGAAAVEDVHSLFTGALTKEEAAAAFEAGKQNFARMMQETAKKTAENAKRYGYEQYTPDTQKHTGVMFAEVKNRLNNTQQTMLKVIDRFAREYGMQVRVHDTMGTANGKYTRNTNTVDVALDAEHGALTRVVSHEMYHFLRQFNPTAARKLQQLVTDTLQRNGVDVGARVQKLISNYAKNNVNLTEEAALEEITADGMLDFIGTEENLKALVKESRSTAERISAWLKNAVAKLRSIMQKVAGKNEVVAGLMDDAVYMEQRSRVLDEALKQAGENYQAVQRGLYEGVKSMPAVQEYLQEMSSSTNRQQAQEAFDALALEAFSRTQTEWMKNNPDGDYQQALGRFADALKRYARGEVFMRQALEDAGFHSPTEGSSNMAMLAYVGNQASLNDFATMREAAQTEDVKYSMKEEADEADLMTELNNEPSLIMQIRMDENVMSAVDTFQQLRKNNVRKMTGKMLDELVVKTANRIIADTGTKMSLSQLKKELRRLYNAMNIQPGNEIQYADADILRYSRMIARHALQKTEGATEELTENEREIRDLIRSMPISLNDAQRSEVAAVYGTVQSFNQKNFGRMRLRKFDRKTSDLEGIWMEYLHPLNPSVFAEDVNAAEMPLILDAYLDRIYTRQKSATLRTDAEYEATKIALKNLLDFYDVAYDEESIQKAIKQKGMTTGEAERIVQEYDPALVGRMRSEMQSAITAMALEYEERYQRRLQGDKSRRETTEKKKKIREGIRKDAKYMNDRLLMNAKEKHIPDPLKGAVLRMMEALTSESGVFYGDRLTQLRQAYKTLEDVGEYADVNAARMYNPKILEKIETLENTLNNKRLTQLNEKQLQDVADIVANIKHMVQQANAMFIDGRKEDFTRVGQMETETLKGKKDKKHSGGIIQKTLSSNTTPIYFFKTMGGVWKKMFDDIMAGQTKWAFTQDKARKFLNETMEKYHANEWINSKDTLRFKSTYDEQLELNRQQALALYATWKRENTNTIQQAQHLKIGGFKYEKDVKYKDVDVHKPHRLTQMDMNTIIGWLGEDGIKFADEMVRYLSQDMAALGNETSMALYGYKEFGEGYYFPYKTSRDYLSVDLTKADTADVANALRGWGASKQLQKKANKPVEVGNFLDTWAKHVNEMGIYNAFTVPVDNMSRLYNYIQRDADDNMTSMRSEIRRVYGEEADAYIKALIQDIAGGVTKRDRTDVADKMISLSKKASVVASASVVVQQPSSIMRAMALINPKYFATPGNVVKEWKQLRQYSGAAIVKEMGRFDTGTGRSATEWLLKDVKAESLYEDVKNKADDALGWAPEKADQMTWAMIWHAVKKEVAEQQGLDMNTEEGLKAAAKRFDEVITYTQVYDSVLSKSHIMRDKGGMAKMMTAFMAEPTVSFNLLKDAITHMKDKDYVGRVSVKRAAAAYTASVMVNAILKSLVTAGRDDDENRTYAEKYVAELTDNFVNDWNPMALLPGVRDVISIFQGYDVERTDMSIIADLKDGLDVMMKWANGDEVKTSAIVEKGLGSIANLFGVPLRNIARDVRTFGNIIGGKPLADTKGVNIKYGVLEGLPFGIYGSKATDYYHRMADAAAKGDTAKYNELMAYLQDAQGKKKETIETGVKKDLKEQFQSGEISKDNTVDILSNLLGVEKDKAYWQADEWESGSADYSKYDELYAAIEGKKSPKKAIDELLKHGTKKANIKAQITSEYKAKYIELYKQNKAQAADLKAYILTALEMLGYNRQEASKAIDAWLKE